MRSVFSRAVLLISLISLFCVGGCVRSVHPFHDQADATFDENFAGVFTNAERDVLITVKPDPESKSYTVLIVDKDAKPAKLIARLSKIGDRTIVDLSIEDPQDSDQRSGFFWAHLVRVHSMLLIHETRPTLKVSGLNHRWLRDYLQKHPDRLEHTQVGSDDLLLTASTAKLRAFVQEQIENLDDNPEAFGDVVELIPVRPATE